MSKMLIDDRGGFGFVLNVSSLDAASYELGPNCVLRRASDEEVERIKKTLERANSFELREGFHSVPWERKLFATPRTGTIELLPKEQWRYFVISFEGPGIRNLLPTPHSESEVEDVVLASCLASLELEVGFTLFRLDPRLEHQPGGVWYSDRLFQSLKLATFPKSQYKFFREVTRADVEEICAINSQLKLGDSQIRNLVEQLQSLKQLPHHLPLCFLGYFALLESVLTHAPKPEDRYDSITRQVKKKLSLLNGRWTRKIDYRPFAGADPEKVWGRMYDYRSAIAHGGNADFSGDLKLLKGPSEALALVRETVKAVIRQALIEPQLLRDLREC